MPHIRRNKVQSKLTADARRGRSLCLDRAIEAERRTQPLRRTQRVVARCIRTDVDAEQAVSLAHFRFDARTRALVRHMRDKCLRVGVIAERAQLDNEAAPGFADRQSDSTRRAVPTEGSATAATRVEASPGRMLSTSTSPLPFCAMPMRYAAA